MAVWKDVAGFEGLYQVSDAGDVISLPRTVHQKNGRVRRTKRCFLKPWNNGHGYPAVSLGRSCKKALHIIVCEAFHGPKPPGHEVAHNNGVRADARAENLRWATRTENHADKTGHGTLMKGGACWNAKLNPDAVMAIREDTRPIFEIAAAYGVHRNQIHRVRRRAVWAHV